MSENCIETYYRKMHYVNQKTEKGTTESVFCKPLSIMLSKIL